MSTLTMPAIGLDDEVVIRDTRLLNKQVPGNVLAGPWYVIDIRGVAATILCLPDTHFLVTTTTALSNLRRAEGSR